MKKSRQSAINEPIDPDQNQTVKNINQNPTELQSLQQNNQVSLMNSLIWLIMVK